MNVGKALVYAALVATVDPDELRARISGRLRELMLRRKVTYTSLAKEAGVSRTHVYKILNGQTSPTGDVLAKLARALAVDPVAFLRPYRKSADD